MPAFTDQLGREIVLNEIPQRIVSAVPSQTELLFYLGLDEQVAGLTKYCIYPGDKIKAKVKIGGTKQLDLQKIKSLKPDLIIANKEENDRAQVEELMTLCPVWISDINGLPSALSMINAIGEMTGKATAAYALSEAISQKFAALVEPVTKLNTAYFIWRKPYMAAGTGTYINDILSRCGLINVFNETRYPEINTEMLVNANPEVVLLSSEPYPFKNKHIKELQEILPRAIIKLVDGELFSWYGSRLLLAPDYFEALAKELNTAQSASL